MKFISLFSSSAVRLILGLVLTGASASKILSFDSFSLSIARLAGIPGQYASAAALVLLVVECVSGLLLLTGYSVRPAASAAAILFVSFTAVLSSAVIRGAEVPCQCFGSLGPKLPLREQGLLDLAFAVASVYLIRAVTRLGNGGKKSRLPLGVALVAAILWGSALILWPRQEKGGVVPSGTPAAFLEGSPEGPQPNPSVMLLVDFDDFGCQLCLDDFLAFCDSLNEGAYVPAAAVRLVARRDADRSMDEQAHRLDGWAAGNKYAFSISVDGDSTFERSGAGTTSAVLRGKDGHTIDFVHFPLGAGKRAGLLRALRD